MAYEILSIGDPDLCPDLVSLALSRDLDCNPRARRVTSMPEVEEVLIATPVCLVVADMAIPGVFDYLSGMKQDEVFRHVPVIMVVDNTDMETRTRAYQAGINNVVKRDELSSLLPILARPLVTTFFYNEDQQKQIGELQEAAIHDFILVDLIKDYIPKTIWDIAKAYAHLQKIAIPEEETELTLVFADIKGFSTIAQHMKPRDVIETLNAVFSIASKIIYESCGDIDKFIGDAFFAVYKDASAAVMSMVRLQRELADMNDKRAASGLPVVQFRIGIHTGTVIRGNVGGNHRFDNTLIGDTVNIASRLETIASAGGIMVSDFTLRRAGIRIPEKFMRRERLRGRDVEDTVYEVFEHLSRIQTG
ncbi:MAG: adenylate/guanylate cyclase domain-containing protein [Spirochaetaceae bacterium]|nr:MAG: adenylate/guanylate cyclase domain-containing protein [Spirochaetaceae bacterium]